MSVAENFLNEGMCEKCGGECCKTIPGAYFPEDFKEPLKDSLLKSLSSGLLAVDWWDGDITGKDERGVSYFIRPKIKNCDLLLDGSWGGECNFLDLNGCKLNPDERPRGCRLLEPKADNKCKPHKNSNKSEACLAWIPHQNLIMDIVNKLGAI